MIDVEARLGTMNGILDAIGLYSNHFDVDIITAWDVYVNKPIMDIPVGTILDKVILNTEEKTIEIWERVIVDLCIESKYKGKFKYHISVGYDKKSS